MEDLPRTDPRLGGTAGRLRGIGGTDGGDMMGGAGGNWGGRA